MITIRHDPNGGPPIEWAWTVFEIDLSGSDTTNGPWTDYTHHGNAQVGAGTTQTTWTITTTPTDPVGLAPGLYRVTGQVCSMAGVCTAFQPTPSDPNSWLINVV
jgi:hypothetical protein